MATKRKTNVAARSKAAKPRKAAKSGGHVNPYPSMPKAPKALAKVRDICLALPEATEKIAWGAPTFRVKDKLFVMFVDNHHGEERISLWCNATVGSQQALVGSDTEIFFVPPYVGKSGWVGIHLDRGLDWSIVVELVKEAYRKTAPARLAALLDT